MNMMTQKQSPRREHKSPLLPSKSKKIQSSKAVSLCALLALGITLSLPLSGHALVTPFGERVNDAIDLGLQWLRNNQNADGGWGEGTGLAILCFLEKRQSADWAAQPQGYINMPPEDQQRVQSGVKYCIQRIPGFEQGGVNSYQTSACLMAMSTYLSTMGPDDVGANTTVTGALSTGVQQLKNMQGIAGQNSPNDGGFDYNSRNNRGDMSTTQFAMAGLFASERILPQAANTLPLARGFINNTRGGDGGHAYAAFGNSNNHAMTASGAWTYLLSGLTPEDPNVQGALSWLQQNYVHDNNGRQGSGNSQYYYLWASAKAFEVSVGQQAGAIYSDQIGGVLDPASLGYPEESARWYFDYAWFLLNDQGGNGNWCANNNISCWSGSVPATSYALLILLRSLGGVCLLDEDEDELCAAEDNCPEVPNPDQLDTDMDGVGDVCDNCWDVPNPDQVDDDGDGIGDLCDDLVCAPDGLPDLCDGLDNDCDASVDEEVVEQGDVEQMNPYCATGQPGVCARGTEACINGEVVCVPQFNPSDEICDGLDNDCDGLIDEEVANACGGCGALNEESCNGEDDDCDGEVDESEGICGDYQVCHEGICRYPCDVECPDTETWCDNTIDLCLPPCDSIECSLGQLCDTNSFMCYDPCEGVECPNANDRCWEGECVPDTCTYTGCEEGSICDGVECVPDPCANVTCESGDFCRGGQCIPSCAAISCPLYTECRDGLCVDDPCGGVQCTNTEACIDGSCVPDPCANVICQEGEECVDGACQWSGCEGVECPPGQLCEWSDVGAQCVRSWVVPPPNPNPPMSGGQDMLDPPMGGGSINDVIPSNGGQEGGMEPAKANAEGASLGCLQSQGQPASLPVLALLLLGLFSRVRRREY